VHAIIQTSGSQPSTRTLEESPDSRSVLLVVSSDAALLLACRSVAEASGRRLVEASDASDILDLIRGAAEPLVVLDGSGSDTAVEEVTRRVRRAPGISHVVLFVAGDERSTRAASLLDAGADDVLPHPSLLQASGTATSLFDRRLAMAISAADARIFAGQLEVARTSLTLQKAFFEHLFECAPEGIVVVDADDRILRANGEFCRMFGYTHPEIIGRAVNELIAPPPFREEADSITLRVRNSEPVSYETTRCRKDGSPLDVSLLATPIHAGSDKAGTFGIYRDITEQKSAERGLRANEERYRYLFDRNPHPMFVYDWESRRFIAVNQTAVEQYGYSREEFLAMSVFDIRPAEDIPLLEQHLSSTPVGLRHAGTWRHKRRDGSLIWVEITSMMVAFAGRPAQLVMANDVTQRLAAERRLQDQTRELERVNTVLQERTRELEDALRARSRLYAAMSHELRTPISAIMLYNDLLLSGTLGVLNREQAEGLDHSQYSARHLLDLVNDVLDLAQVDSGTLSMNEEDVCVATFVKELLSTAHPIAASRGSTLGVSLPETPCVLRTDPRRLRQILLNLLSNAAKFGGGKPIELICRCTCAAGGGSSIVVRDHGNGIDPTDQERIFEDFVRIGAHAEEGTGLGLPIARRLAELLGGTLTVHSEIGAGSEFRLELAARLGGCYPAEQPGFFTGEYS
jgi:PAS domain S-box-containing protein